MFAGFEKYLVFVPLYNDHKSLVDVLVELEALPKADFQILVIDDGSPSSLGQEMAYGNILYHRLPDNCGLGSTLNIAILFALKHGFAGLIRIDADGQHPVANIPTLIAQLKTGGADVISGGRVNHAVYGARKDWLRLSMKKYYSAWAKILTRRRTPEDVNTGCFALSRHAIATLAPVIFGRFPEPQLFITAARLGLTIVEVPIQQRLRRHGRTTLNLSQAVRMFYRFNMFMLAQLIRRKPS